MNDSVFNLESSEETFAQKTSSQDDAPPEFGLVDVVEAFTAMRHEWRGQTKESRAVAESILAAVTSIQELESRLRAHVTGCTADASRQLAKLIAETDHQLTRALRAVGQSETNRRHREESDTKAILRYFEGMNAMARWFARPLLSFVMEQHQAGARPTENPAIEGLNLVLARLRRTMKEQQIERLDSLGKAFDANTMNAIGTVESQDFPSGHVAEQLAPGYRWRGQILRFADVRVADTCGHLATRGGHLAEGLPEN